MDIQNRNVFFDESTPLAHVEPNGNSCCNLLSLNYKNRVLYAKIVRVASLIFIGGVGIYGLYDAVNTLQTKPISSRDSIFAIFELCGAGGLAMITCAISAAVGSRLGLYHNQLDEYPHSEHYQGSFADILEWDLMIRYDIQDIEVWKPYVRAFFNKMKTLNLLDPWLKAKKYEDVEQAIEKVSKKLRKGLCYGTSMALLTKMRSHASLPSAELRDKIELEDIVYYQLMVIFICNSTNKNKSDFYQKIYSHLEPKKFLIAFWNEWGPKKVLECMQKDKEEENQIQLEIEEPGSESSMEKEFVDHLKIAYKENLSKYVTREMLFLKLAGVDLENILVYQEQNMLKIKSSNKDELVSCFSKAKEEIKSQAKKKKLEELTLAGVIALNILRQEKEDGATVKGSGHALFFQISDGYFRFHDSGSELHGFFEFPSEELMMESLLEHIKTWDSSYKWEDLEFTLLGIPQDKPKSKKCD